MSIYYVYAYLREDETPYYIGKGKGNRAWCKSHRVRVPTDHLKIKIICKNLTNDEAVLLEIELISKYGRKDLGTGILRNMTNGGDGVPGKIWTDSARAAVSAAKQKWHHENDTTGVNNPMHGRVHSDEVKAASRERAIKHSFIGNRKGKEAWNKGTRGSVSNETRQKMSASRLLTPKGSCIHCGILVAPHILSRFHNDKCKLNENLASNQLIHTQRIPEQT